MNCNASKLENSPGISPVSLFELMSLNDIVNQVYDELASLQVDEVCQLGKFCWQSSSQFIFTEVSIKHNG